jgi:hypothetical protein
LGVGVTSQFPGGFQQLLPQGALEFGSAMPPFP